MNDTYPRLDLRYVLHTLRRRGPLIGLAVVVVFVLVYVLSSLQPKVYTASAEVQITRPPIQAFEVEGKEDVSLGNEIYLMTSTTVRRGVQAEMGSDDMRKIRAVGVSRLPETDILRVTVSSTSPEIAQTGADLYAETYLDLRIEQLQQAAREQAASMRDQAEVVAAEIANIDAQIAASPEGSQADVLRADRNALIAQQSQLNQSARALEDTAAQLSTTVRLVKKAGLPKLPDSPTPLRDAGIAAVVTLIVGIGVAFLYDQLDTRIKSTDDVIVATGGIPVLGSVPSLVKKRWPFSRGDPPRELVPIGSSAAESFRTLATSLRFSGLGKEKRRILITSASSGEGKTTLTANLASVLAENGLRVLIVSADLRRPQLGEMFGSTDVEKGLTSVILGDEELLDVLVNVSRSGDEAITLLPSGPLPHDPSVLLGSNEFGEMLDQFEAAGADFILIDCAPVLPVSDPLAVARHVDGVLLVSRFGRTRKGELRQAIDRLEKVDAEVIGVVVNRVSESTEYAYAGGYGYAPT